MATDQSGFQSQLQKFGSNFRNKFEDTKNLIYQLKAVSYSEKSTDFGLYGAKCLGDNASDFRRNLTREITENRVELLEKRNTELSQRLSVNETIIQRFIQLITTLQNEFNESLKLTSDAEENRIRENKEATSKLSQVDYQLKASETTVKIKDDEIKRLNGKISDLQVDLNQLEKKLKEVEEDRRKIYESRNSQESKLQRVMESLQEANFQNQQLTNENQRLLDEDRRTKRVLEQIEDTHRRELDKYEQRFEIEASKHESEMAGIHKQYEAELAENVAAITTRLQLEMETQRKIHEKALKKAKDQTDELMKYREQYFQLQMKFKDLEDKATKQACESLDDAKRRLIMEQALNARKVLANRHLAQEKPENLANVFLNDFRGSDAGSITSSSLSDADENRPYIRPPVPTAQKRHRAASETRDKRPRSVNLVPQVVFQSRNPRPPFRKTTGRRVFRKDDDVDTWRPMNLNSDVIKARLAEDLAGTPLAIGKQLKDSKSRLPTSKAPVTLNDIKSEVIQPDEDGFRSHEFCPENAKGVKRPEVSSYDGYAIFGLDNETKPELLCVKTEVAEAVESEVNEVLAPEKIQVAEVAPLQVTEATVLDENVLLSQRQCSKNLKSSSTPSEVSREPLNVITPKRSTGTTRSSKGLTATTTSIDVSKSTDMTTNDSGRRTSLSMCSSGASVSPLLTQNTFVSTVTPSLSQNPSEREVLPSKLLEFTGRKSTSLGPTGSPSQPANNDFKCTFVKQNSSLNGCLRQVYILKKPRKDGTTMKNTASTSEGITRLPTASEMMNLRRRSEAATSNKLATATSCPFATSSVKKPAAIINASRMKLRPPPSPPKCPEWARDLGLGDKHWKDIQMSERPIDEEDAKLYRSAEKRDLEFNDSTDYQDCDDYCGTEYSDTLQEGGFKYPDEQEYNCKRWSNPWMKKVRESTKNYIFNGPDWTRSWLVKEKESKKDSESSKAAERQHSEEMSSTDEQDILCSSSDMCKVLEGKKWTKEQNSKGLKLLRNTAPRGKKLTKKPSSKVTELTENQGLEREESPDIIILDEITPTKNENKKASGSQPSTSHETAEVQELNQESSTKNESKRVSGNQPSTSQDTAEVQELNQESLTKKKTPKLHFVKPKRFLFMKPEPTYRDISLKMNRELKRTRCRSMYEYERRFGKTKFYLTVREYLTVNMRRRYLESRRDNISEERQVSMVDNCIKFINGRQPNSDKKSQDSKKKARKGGVTKKRKDEESGSKKDDEEHGPKSNNNDEDGTTNAEKVPIEDRSQAAPSSTERVGKVPNNNEVAPVVASKKKGSKSTKKSKKVPQVDEEEAVNEEVSNKDKEGGKTPKGKAPISNEKEPTAPTRRSKRIAETKEKLVDNDGKPMVDLTTCEESAKRRKIVVEDLHL
ncbi:unnamed protein product [Bursaphelenchus okinawaensis]|uniref:Uncharacterized protein n=1 Tax=Bursaphelenchus okinawaensis TaxID=465554 RepID=A0A811JQ63_9BILA|nr:unnamed protein product [Bursaphelenchus okinawaensis]CAG9077286.1 unnamed protein product [Bursaphelenchus okinawaensis]